MSEYAANWEEIVVDNTIIVSAVQCGLEVVLERGEIDDSTMQIINEAIELLKAQKKRNRNKELLTVG